MGDILLYSTITIIVLILLNLIISIYSKINDIRIKKINNRNSMYVANINAVIDESVYKLLDTLIEECFNEYLVLNVLYNKPDYINNELENEICTNVANLVGSRISPTLIDKLSLVYNPNMIGELIAKKTYIYTLNYTVQTNQPKIAQLRKK